MKEGKKPEPLQPKEVEEEEEEEEKAMEEDEVQIIEPPTNSTIAETDQVPKESYIQKLFPSIPSPGQSETIFRHSPQTVLSKEVDSNEKIEEVFTVDFKVFSDAQRYSKVAIGLSV